MAKGYSLEDGKTKAIIQAEVKRFGMPSEVMTQFPGHTRWPLRPTFQHGVADCGGGRGDVHRPGRPV
ncbi:hypothetical protein WDV93_03110 [Pantoea ananatis]